MTASFSDGVRALLFHRLSQSPVSFALSGALGGALAALTLGACAPALQNSTSSANHAATRSLAFVIDSITAAAPMQHTAWGIEVIDQQSGAVSYQKNSNIHFIPASNTKLVVTTAAMGSLGPDFRYHTTISAGPSNSDGAVNGILIEGSGDPTLSARFWGTPYAAVKAIADSIYTAGVRRIDGPLVVDASRFPDSQINGAWEVSDLPSSNAPPVAAFAIEEGMQRIIISAGSAPGAAVTASTPAWPSGVSFHSAGYGFNVRNVQTDSLNATSSLQVDYLSRRDTIRLSGRVPVGRADTGSYAVTDAPMYAGQAVAAALDARGITLRDGVVVIRDAAAATRARATYATRVLVVMTSPPLAAIESAILHVSQNWIAEMLLKTLGATTGTNGTWSGGIAVERSYLTKVVGLDSLDFNLRDGSGLSAQNLLTPHAMVRILEHARTAPWHDAYAAALAAPGEPGTMENRLKEYQGRLRTKTGTISNVASLSGYLTTDNGRAVTFTIMTNGTGLGSAMVRRASDDIVRAIARAPKQ